MSAPPSSEHPTHLDPSELGTKDYWDNYYANDISNLEKPGESHEDAEASDGEDDAKIDPSELPSWFSDVSAPEKILSYLTSEAFPLSPETWPEDGPLPSVLDLGTGNGSLLFQLRTEGEFIGNRMCGIDYSEASIDLSKRLGKEIGEGCEEIEFEQCDILKRDWKTAPWWPKGQEENADNNKDTSGWDIVLDKGTFDAISLSAEEVEVAGERRRICELYPEIVTEMVKLGGYLLITSCNWTEEEVIRWFVPEQQQQEQQGKPRLELFGKIKYSTFRFAGQVGQGVASVCFKRIR